MKKLTWKIKHIQTQNEILDLVNIYNEYKPDYSAIDTETDGLHIKLCTPFVVTFGWYNEKTKQAYAFSFDLTHNPSINNSFFNTLYFLTNKTKKCLCWNTKFDMHMLANIKHPYPNNNYSDVQIYVRTAHDAIPIKEGGVSIELSAYAAKFIEPDARFYLNEINKEKTRLTKIRSSRLKAAGYSSSYMNKFFKDKTNEIQDLPADAKRIYLDCLDPNNYKNYDRKTLLLYACYDVIYTLEAFYQCLPIALYRKQQEVIDREEKCIMPLWKMERRGFKLNKEYAITCKANLKAYILKQRNKLYNLLGKTVGVSQHKEIKNILYNRYGISLESTNNEALTTLTFNDNKTVKSIAETIIELRTLEKWYSTYIIKWTEYMDKTDRIYTSIKQCGAVSGRVTSDFQQFPKDAIYDEEGHEIFNPRKLVTVSGDGYNKIAYLDYSQIELRFQALYTIYVMGGDLNMCRAYMPFKCHTSDKLKFDFNNPEHLKNFKQHVWYLDENNKEWYPIDLHSATTQTAFPELIQGTEEFKHKRPYGKSTNFACNYGASKFTLNKQFGYPMELAERLYNAYYNTFQGVKVFAEYVQKYLYEKPYIANLFGRRYYGANAHKCRNYIIQGSGADFLKIKIIEIDNFLVSNNLRSAFQMNIHDEMSFEIYDNEEWIIPKLKEIMEDLPGTKVPIVADVEITYTTWSEAEDYPL